MSPMFRKITATAVLAIAVLVVAAPQVGAATTDTANHAKLYSLTGVNGGKVGDAVVSFDHHQVTVWAATSGLAPGTYSVRSGCSTWDSAGTRPRPCAHSE